MEIAEFFDFYFRSARPSSAGGWLTIDMSAPKEQWIDGFDDFPIVCPSLVEPWETVAQYLDLARLKEGERVIDLGAYSGLTSIAFARQVGLAGRVLAVEPDPVNASAAKLNIARNDEGAAIELFEGAAAAADGIVMMMCEGTMGSGLASVLSRGRSQTSQISARSLQSLVEQIGGADLIKIDIEGAEVEVIEGSLAFLQSHRPRLIIEAHRVNGRLTADHVETLLQSVGYSCRRYPQTGAALPLICAELRQML